MEPSDFLPILTKTAERYKDRVQHRITNCELCQPRDDGEFVWVFGEKVELESLFYELNVPERYWNDISAHLHCPWCGRDGFDPYDSVGVEGWEERDARRHLEKAIKKFGSQIEAFEDHLTDYPMLGMEHALGRKILQIITQGDVPEIKIAGTFFRARRLEGGRVFSPSDLGAPEVGIAGEGRYNHAGQSTLYLARTAQTAIREVLGDERTPFLIWVQEYEIGGECRILDLTADYSELGRGTGEAMTAILASGTLEKPVIDRTTRWKPQYFVPRFVADCARKAGYHGIQYVSTQDGGSNLVLFDLKSVNLLANGEPRVLRSDRLPVEYPELDF